jgi:hypothetical protein
MRTFLARAAPLKRTFAWAHAPSEPTFSLIPLGLAKNITVRTKNAFLRTEFGRTTSACFSLLESAVRCPLSAVCCLLSAVRRLPQVRMLLAFDAPRPGTYNPL